jgi:carotenoid cleavage dioxygenase
MNKVVEIKDPRNPFLRGNFAPVDEELDSACNEVVGEIPQDLAGAFLRIGSNPVFVADIEKYHWFDGDGMVHEVLFDGGQATYRNRYVMTRGLKLELEKGDWIWKGLNSPPDMANPHGLFKNAANTAMVFHSQKLLALWEGGNPHHLTLPALETVGEVDFNGALKHAFTAHPKVDAQTGEMIAFGYNMMMKPYLVYYVIDKNGVMTNQVQIDLPKGVMMHDCAMTEHHTIFMDLPVVGDLEAAMAGKPAIRWDPDNGSRVGIIPRHGKAEDMRWFDIDTCFVFHTVNAYEDGDEVVLEACRSPKTNVIGADPGTESDQGDMPHLYEWRFNLKTGAVKERFLDREHACEFPRINDNLMGKRHRYAYCARIAPEGETGGMFDGLIKYDRKTGDAQHYDYGPGRSGGEVIFAPRDNGKSEDDGWVIGFVWDENTQRSECLVIEASRFEDGPVARVMLPGRVPFGFHAAWVDKAGIDSQR